MRVTSTDHVELAVHDLGGRGRQLLVSHATGFHGRCYLPMAAALADRYHSIAFDYRGHGDTPQPAGVPVDWRHYGDDALAMARTLTAPVVAFGHSMGGACLLMAAHREPHLFERLVLFEPIVFPPQGIRDGAPSPLVVGARRRRPSFPSYDDAMENFGRKQPLASFTHAALEAYVRYGFAESDDGQVHLKCRPEIEAATFEMGPHHHTWDDLPEIQTPVLVVAGVVQEQQPSAIAAQVAERLPNATYLERPDLDHFGPMTHPDLMAGIVADYLA